MDNRYFEIISRAIYVNKLHKRAIESQVLDMELSQGEHRILMHIYKEERCRSQKSLAEAHRITPAAVTQILTSLEEKGLIERRASRDCRFNEIIITNRGQSVVKETRTRFSDIDKEMFRGFTEKELSMYFDFLLRLENNLKTINGGMNNEKMV